MLSTHHLMTSLKIIDDKLKLKIKHEARSWRFWGESSLIRRDLIILSSDLLEELSERRWLSWITDLLLDASCNFKRTSEVRSYWLRRTIDLISWLICQSNSSLLFQTQCWIRLRKNVIREVNVLYVRRTEMYRT